MHARQTCPVNMISMLLLLHACCAEQLSSSNAPNRKCTASGGSSTQLFSTQLFSTRLLISATVQMVCVADRGIAEEERREGREGSQREQ
jgi:hypothetical protein